MLPSSTGGTGEITISNEASSDSGTLYRNVSFRTSSDGSFDILSWTDWNRHEEQVVHATVTRTGDLGLGTRGAKAKLHAKGWKSVPTTAPGAVSVQGAFVYGVGTNFTDYRSGAVPGSILQIPVGTEMEEAVVVAVLSATTLMVNKMFSANSSNSVPYTFKHPIARFDDSTGVPRMLVTQAGNTGIGAMIPDQKLTLAEQDKRVDNVGILFRSSMTPSSLVEDTMRIRSGWHNSPDDKRDSNKALSIEGRSSDPDNLAGWREVLAARSDGHVGISVSAPSERLHVIGNTYTEGRVIIGPAKQEFDPNEVLEERFAFEVSRATAQQEPLAPTSVGEDDGVRAAHASRYSGMPSGLGDLEFLDTNDQSYLTVSSKGVVGFTHPTSYVGVGTNNPIHRLHIRGTGYLDGALLIRGAGNYEPLNGGRIRHRTNFSFVAGNETGNLEVRDYEGTSAFTMTPNGTIWLSSDHADLCSRSASNHSICNGRFIGIGTKRPLEKLHLVGSQFIEGGELSIRSAESTGNYTVSTRRGSGKVLEVYEMDGTHVALSVSSVQTVGVGNHMPSARLHVFGAEEMTLSQTHSYLEAFSFGNKSDRLQKLLSPAFNGTDANEMEGEDLQPELLKMMEERLTTWFGELHVGDVVTLIDGESQISPQSSIVKAIRNDGSVTLVDSLEVPSGVTNASNFTVAYYRPIARFDDRKGATRLIVDGDGNLALGRRTSHERMTIASQDDNQETVGIMFRTARTDSARLRAYGDRVDGLRLRAGWHNTELQNYGEQRFSLEGRVAWRGD